MDQSLSYDALRAKQKQLRDDWTPDFGLRIHRALSWLNRAEHNAGDPDSEFVFHWIAFNAAYGRFIDGMLAKTQNERDRYELFVKMLVSTDRKQRIANLLFDQYSDSIVQLIGNRYVFFEFWNSRLFVDADIDWEHKLNIEVNQASGFERKRASLPYLMIVLSRLHVLRNQIIHGAATWNSTTNRQQVQDAAAFTRHFVPLIIDIMMDDPDQEWGEPLYPVQY